MGKLRHKKCGTYVKPSEKPNTEICEECDNREIPRNVVRGDVVTSDLNPDLEIVGD